MATTQYAIICWITGDISNTYKTPFPAMNVSRRNAPVATDQIYSDMALFGGGYEVSFVELKGYLMVPEVRQTLSAIVGFYFGNAAAGRKT